MRRRAFALATALALAGCGGGGKSHTASTNGCAAPSGSPQATFSTTIGGPQSPRAIRDTATVLCRRAAAFGAQRPWVRVRGGRIELGASSDLKQLLARISAPGRLAFYDWEPNLVSRRVLPTIEVADRVASSTRDSIVVADQPTQPRGFWVIRDRPALTNADIVNPQQSIDQTGKPDVTFGFTPHGRAAFQRLTRAEALRGGRMLIPPGQSRESSFQHFAIVLDDRLVSLPFIDYQQNPDGIDGRNGAEIAGVGSLTETRGLARELALGPLRARLALERSP